jgi:pyruvate/2-oxoglutarate/acetoin dehydrogenase E1 component
MEASRELLEVGINAEVIDVQSLLPLDINHDIVKSIAKTNRVLIIDEDVEGGASAYILNEILNKQNAFEHLDSQPKTLASKPHRPAYGTDGDYFSKPSTEDIFETVYTIMHELNPTNYPALR